MKTVYLGRYNEIEPLTGPEKVACRIFSEHSRDNESEFITYFFDGRKYGVWKKLFGIEVLTVKGKGRVIRAGILTAMFRLISMRPDNIHIINFERFAAVGFIYKFLFGAKVIYTVHGIAAYENERYKTVTESYRKRDKKTESAFFKYSDKIVFLSEQSMEIAEEIYSIDRSKCIILPNGIDKEFHNSNELDVSTPQLSVVFSGNISRPEKGFAELHKLFLSETLPVRLYAVNSGRNGEEGVITYMDSMRKDELTDFLSGKHIFISSSLYEPFSLSAVEAMASGLVVIASNKTGMIRYIKNGVNGFIYEVTEPEQISDLIKKLNDDRELLRSVSSAARKIYDELSWDKVYEQYKALYK